MPIRSLAVILNPAAGNRRAGQARARLEAALEATGVPFEIVVTERPNHASALARRAAAYADAVVAAGGDGTVHEVAAGLLGADRAALGVIPLGTGNDFADVLGLPKRTPDAVRALLAAEAVPTDGGTVRWREAGDGRWHEAVFINAVGIGFDALVAAEAERTKWLRGVSGYAAAVLRTLRRWTQPTVEARSLGPGGAWREVYRGPLFLAAVGNGTSVGGGFRLTPEARLDDGLLDLCLVAGPLALRRILRLMPRAFRGHHLGEPEVTAERIRRFSLRTEHGVPVHLDGEVLTRSAVEVTVAVQPGAFRVLRPVGGGNTKSG